MGVLKKYSAFIAADSLRLTAPTDGSAESDYRRKVPAWYDENGEEWKQLIGTLFRGNYGSSYYEYCYNLTTFWQDLIPVATEDNLDEYYINDFSCIPTGITSYSNTATYSDVSGERTFAIRITNSNPTDSYIQNTDPIWRDYREYYTREGEQEPYTYTRLYDEPSNFITTYRNYYILIPAGPITIKCIKFKRRMYVIAKDLGGSNWYSKKENKMANYCAYFLDEDEWITIPVGESRVIVVDFSAITA